MKEQHDAFINQTFGFRKLIPDDVSALLKAGFPYERVLNQSIVNRFYGMTGLAPKTIGLVVYHVQENWALGYLSLIKYTSSVYGVKFVFVAPDYRKMGLASGLLDYALSYAKQRGARKVFLNPDSKDDVLLNFYLKRGFRSIVNSLVLWGGQSPENMQYKQKGNIVSATARPENNIDRIFSIYKEYMGTNWIDFFELNRHNILNGFSQEFKNFFSKDAFIISSTNCIALIFKRPFSRVGSVELYVSSTSVISHLLNELAILLSKKGIVWSKITIFNVNGTDTFNLLNEMEFHPFQARILGRSV